MVYRKPCEKCGGNQKPDGWDRGPAVLESSPEGWEGSLYSCLRSSAWTGAGGGCNRVLK